MKKEPKSVPVRIKSPSASQPVAVSILTAHDARQSPAALCHITKESMLLVTRDVIECDTMVFVEMPTECLAAGVRKALTGGVHSCKALSSAGQLDRWLLTCRLSPHLAPDELATLERFVPKLPRGPA